MDLLSLVEAQKPEQPVQPSLYDLLRPDQEVLFERSPHVLPRDESVEVQIKRSEGLGGVELGGPDPGLDASDDVLLPVEAILNSLASSRNLRRGLYFEYSLKFLVINHANLVSVHNVE